MQTDGIAVCIILGKARAFIPGLSTAHPLLWLIKQIRTYSAAVFHFLIFVRNVPKGATVLTWMNL